MNSRHILKGALAALTAIALTACNQNKFKVEGTISQAADSTVYLENIGLEGISQIDSVRLDDNGSFSFSGEAPSAPEFYRLRIADEIINVCIDSTETIRIKATYPNMALNYTLEGEGESLDNNTKIMELTRKQMELQQKAINIQKNTALGVDEANDSILGLIASYKNEVKNDYIFKNPMKPYSYFALFQTLGNWLIFNPRTDKEDIKVFAAVATSWDTYYPHAERGRNLHNIAIEGMKNMKIAEAEQNKTIDPSRIQEAGIIDIALPDNRGQQRHLTELKGQVVLLDFHVFALKDSPARILSLREIYNKYHAQGFEIYQVSLDTDEHFWKQQTAALPWICVRDEDGTGSHQLIMYNIQAVPDFFIIDRGNNLVKRAIQIKDLEAEIRKLL